MSSFRATARHKQNGQVHEFWCIDDYFGRREYGYIRQFDGMEMREKEFKEQYKFEEQP